MPSATLTAAATAQRTSEIILDFIVFSHPDLVTPLRFVNNKEDVVRGGDTYEGFNFEAILPDNVPDRSPLATIKVENIDRQMVEAIRTLSGLKQITITINQALYSTPDTTERGPYEFILFDVDYDRKFISGRMGYDNHMEDRFPNKSMTVRNQPGLHS